MEKFNRSMAREISQKVQEALSEMFKTGNFDYTVNGGSFTDDKLKLNLEVRIKNEDGSLVVSDYRNSAVDSKAKMEGLKFEGHLIGSTWSIRGNIYTVTDYVTKRRASPLTLKRSDGKLSRSAIMFLSQGVQLTVPTEQDFYKWFTIDPDSDAVKESDVEICDRVSSYMEVTNAAETLDKFLALAEKFYDLKIAARYAKRIYKQYITNGTEEAYLLMKKYYKELKGAKK